MISATTVCTYASHHPRERLHHRGVDAHRGWTRPALLGTARDRGL